MLLALATVFLLCSTVFAHSGRTDAYGGHNGPDGYHYHHGYPSHDHENGCPYEFDDKTSHDSGSVFRPKRKPVIPQYPNTVEKPANTEQDKALPSPEPLKCNLEIEERNKQYWADMARILGSVLNSETENKKDKAFEVAKEKILDLPCSDTVTLDKSDHSEIFDRLYEIYNKVREKNTFKKCLGVKSELLGKYIADYKDHLCHIRLLTVSEYLKGNDI